MEIEEFKIGDSYVFERKVKFFDEFDFIKGFFVNYESSIGNVFCVFMIDKKRKINPEMIARKSIMTKLVLTEKIIKW